MSNTYEINLGDALKGAWELFCKGPEIFITIAFVAACLSGLLGGVPGVGLLAAVLVGSLGPAAIYLAADEGVTKEKITFESTKKLKDIFPQLLALLVVKVIAVSIGLALFVLPGIYLLAISCFAELFVTLEGKTFTDALKASKELADRNLLGVVGMTIFLTIFSFSGAMLIGLGMLVTFPLSLLMLFCVFRRASLRVVS